MGKTARNEVLKLTATYLNNIAVGIAIAGLIVPYFVFLQSAPTNSPPLPLYEIYRPYLRYLLPGIAALTLSYIIHLAAQFRLSDLED